MKICYISNACRVFKKMWVESFANRGHDVHLVDYNDTLFKNVKTHVLSIPNIKGFKLPIKIYKLGNTIKEINPDIVHVHGIGDLAYTSAFLNFHPLVVSAMGSDIAIAPEVSKISRLMCKLVLNKADVVHAGDEPAKKRLIELGCDEKKIFVQALGIDTSKFSPDAKSQVLKEELDILDNYSVINARTLIDEKYHVSTLIRSIPYVLKSINNVEFIVAGPGPSESNLKQLTNKLRVNKHVIFLGGIPNEEMPKYLASSDLYVDTFFPVTKKAGGGIGITTIEAMACGVPQILAKRPSVDERDGWFQGLSYESEDPKDLAEKIVYLLKNETLRKEIGKKSRKVALEIGDLEKNMEKFEQVYYRLST